MGPSLRPRPASRLSRAATYVATLVATVLVLVLSSAPAAAAAWIEPVGSVACGEVEEHVERDEADAPEATRARPAPAPATRGFRLASGPRDERASLTAPPEARAFVPPQRKSLLRLHL